MTFELSKQRLLIVDDVPMNIELLATSLKSSYQIKVATSGKKAVEIATSVEPPDLILLDIMMPEMDGFEVCKLLKRSNQTKNIPIIFITAMDEVEDETRGLELGAVDYIVKPFKMPIVKARIKTHLDLKRKADILEELVSLDGLTNIPNRRRFEEVLKKEWKRSLRATLPISLIMVDIDFFKQFNDYYGHGMGDECLRMVAKMLSESLGRVSDFVARYGGEEFVVVLPGTDAEGVMAVAENIRRNTETLNIAHPRSEVADHITLSLGAATIMPNKDASPDDLVGVADKMLYNAKKAGRNQTKFEKIN